MLNLVAVTLTGRGPHNALVRFGLDYLDLLGVVDEDELRSAGTGRIQLLDFLRRRKDGLLAYCLATDDIDALNEESQSSTLDISSLLAQPHVEKILSCRHGHPSSRVSRLEFWMYQLQ